MPTDIKGPAIFLAQFAGDAAPFNSWDSITKWAASLGYKGVQIPSWDGRLFDLKKAADSKTYADEVLGVARANGVEVLCVVDADKSAEVQEAMRTITRAAKTPIALSLVDVATGVPVRRFASGADAPGRKEAVRR